MQTAHVGRKVLCCFGVLSPVLLQCLSISSIHSLSHTVTETLVKFLCVTCAAFFLCHWRPSSKQKSKIRVTFETHYDYYFLLLFYQLIHYVYTGWVIFQCYYTCPLGRPTWIWNLLRFDRIRMNVIYKTIQIRSLPFKSLRSVKMFLFFKKLILFI